MSETFTRRASSPGRVTLLGEHTDYNDGVALAVATTERTTVVASPGDPDRLEVVSLELGSHATSLASSSGPPHVRLAASLARAAGVDGARLAVSSHVPVGAGVSSSAAYAVACALALGLHGDPATIARTCRTAERAAGSDVGLMDQLVVLLARRGSAVGLDFAGPTWTSVPLPADVGLSVVDSGERRTIAASAYRDRRAECERASRVVGPLGRARRADVELLDDRVLRRRARHVVTECERVAAATSALRDGDVLRLGELVDEGHVSLREDFESSTPRVETARDELRRLRGVLGVRLTGAGFGGALVVVHHPDADVSLPGRWSSRLPGADGASVSSSPTAR